jgi:tellurite resistance protein
MDNYKEKRKQEERDKLIKILKSDEEFKKKIEKEAIEERYRKRKDFVRRLHYERREAALDGVVLKVG